MNVPAHNVMQALRRFVGLRSAWRRSLAMELREPGEPMPETNRERRSSDCPGKRCCHV